jgi:BMFP domain-containing protein YqiC
MSPSDSQNPGRALDPFELWRQIYETNERAWNTVLERTVNNPNFAESSGKVLETFLAAQKTIRDNMRTYLESINLPTREDISRLGELIVALEEKVDQLDDRLVPIEARLQTLTTPSAASAPPTPTATPATGPTGTSSTPSSISPAPTPTETRGAASTPSTTPRRRTTTPRGSGSQPQ